MSAGPVVDLASFRSVLVVKPSSLGDIVHTLPAVHFIKRAYPQLRLRWLCNPEWIPLLEGNPDLAEVIPFPRRELGGFFAPLKFLLWAMRLNALPRELPEIILDFQGLMRSALIALLRGSDPVVGMSDAREGSAFFQRVTVPVYKRDHAVNRNLTLVRALGISTPQDEATFTLPEGEPPAGVALPPKFIVLHPFSRGRNKSLTDDCIQSLCDCLAPRPIVIVGRGQHRLAFTGAHVISLLNQTSLPELIWLLRHAHGCVSVDSGPMHIAAAVNPRTLGIHTWSDPRKVGPYPLTATVWKAGRIARRDEFTDSEARDERQVAAGDCRRIADFIHRWYQD
jgi:ADP-heptose:LPS heptosyltransferase